jgi:EEF1A N-terminal glycine/lysine methyltransferase
LILSDLVFNHSQVGIRVVWYLGIDDIQHNALLKTCDETLERGPRKGTSWTPCALVFFTHHRPWLAEKDLDFFTKARESGWECEQVLEEHTGVSAMVYPLVILMTLRQVMFEGDSGDSKVRGTVHGWRMWRE